MLQAACTHSTALPILNRRQLIARLVDDARFELAALDSLGDTLDLADETHLDTALQGIDEAQRLLRQALTLASTARNAGAAL